MWVRVGDQYYNSAATVIVVQLTPKERETLVTTGLPGPIVFVAGPPSTTREQASETAQAFKKTTKFEEAVNLDRKRRKATK